MFLGYYCITLLSVQLATTLLQSAYTQHSDSAQNTLFHYTNKLCSAATIRTWFDWCWFIFKAWTPKDRTAISNYHKCTCMYDVTKNGRRSRWNLEKKVVMLWDEIRRNDDVTRISCSAGIYFSFFIFLHNTQKIFRWQILYLQWGECHCHEVKWSLLYHLEKRNGDDAMTDHKS